MTSLHERYAELVALTQLYLLQEHTPSDRLLADSSCYHYFREYAASRQVAKHSPATLTPQPSPSKSFSPLNPPQAIGSNPLPAKTVAPVLVPNESPKAGSPPSPPPRRPSLPLPQSAPLQTDSKKVSKETHGFNLELPGVPEIIITEDLRKIVHEKLPNLAILDTPPEDSEARQAAREWEKKAITTPIVILSFEETPKHTTFLANICKTLNVYGITAEIVRATKIEHNKGWGAFLQTPQLKLIIASTHGIDTLPDLMTHHREVTKQARHYLGNVPLLLLSDLGFYLKESSLKISLWKALLEYTR